MAIWKGLASCQWITSGSARLYVVASSSQGLTQETCTPGWSNSPENRAEIELVVAVMISAPDIASSTLVASTTSAGTRAPHSSIKRRRDSGVGLKTLIF